MKNFSKAARMVTSLVLVASVSFSTAEAKVSKENTDKAKVLYTQGVQMMGNGSTKEAAAAFMEADKLAEKNPLYELLAGDSLRALKQYPSAIRYYKDAIEHVREAKRSMRKKIEQKAYIGISLAYMESGQEQLAISYIDKSIKEFPEDYRGHYVKGIIYSNNKDELSKAASEFRQSLEIDKTQYNSYVKLIKLLNKMGDINGVINAYKMAVDYRPVDEAMKMSLAQLYIAETKKEGSTKNYYKEAIEVLDSLTGLNPKNALPHYYLSALHLMTGDMEKCKKEMGIVNGLNPNLGKRLSMEVVAYQKKHGSLLQEDKLLREAEDIVTLDDDSKKPEEDRVSGKENILVFKQVQELEKKVTKN